MQVSQSELQQYVSLTSLQNKGLKRHFRELEASTSKLKYKANEKESNATETTVNSIKGSKKRRLAILDNEKQEKDTSNQNIVGFEVSLKQF